MNDYLQDTTINKLLAVQKFLQKKTTPDSYIKQSEIADYLSEEFGWNVKRQTISEYLNLLSSDIFNFGLKSYEMNGNIKKYKYTGIFSEEQLSMLADIICSSTFLDTNTASNLLENIKSFINENKEKEFPDIESFIRPRMLNTQCMKNIKAIHIAINNNRKINFNYADTNSDKQLFYYNKINDHKVMKTLVFFDKDKNIQTKLKPMHIKELHPDTVTSKQSASPYKLMWDNSRCYLVAGLIAKTGEFKIINFRVDRMFNVEIDGGKVSDDEGVLDKHLREFPANSEFFDNVTHEFLAEKFLQSSFKMFTSESGKSEKATFKVAEKFAKTIVDRFGYDVKFKKAEDGYFTFEVNIQPSRPFFSWLAQFSYNEIALVKPNDMVKDYKDFLLGNIADYKSI